MTEKELDITSAFFLVTTEAMGILLTKINGAYEEQMHQSDEYKRISKKYGKAAADMIAKEQTERILKHDDKLQLRRLLAKLKEVQTMLDRISDSASRAGKADYCTNFDCLRNDANTVLRLLCYYSNLADDAALLKAESTLKLLGKANRVPQEYINTYILQ